MIELALKAARAEHIPEGRSGRWAVRRHVTTRNERWVSYEKNSKQTRVPPGTYTLLTCVSETAAMSDLGVEVVMNDSVPELRTHLQAMLTAHGRVLVTGLGLGCVVRGMLAARDEHISEIIVLEREQAVIDLVAPRAFPSDWMNRVRIIHTEAEAWLQANPREKFDCAWHDVWTDVAGGEMHLARKHSQIMATCFGRVRQQDAWAFPHYLKKIVNRATEREASNV